MGNSHSGEANSKPPDKRYCKVIENGNYNKSKILCNQPYLRELFRKLAMKSTNASQNPSTTSCDRVTQQVFEDAFNGPLKVLGRLLFKHIKSTSDTERRSSIRLEEFLEVSTKVLSLLSNTQQLNYYFDVLSEGREHMTIENAYHMVQVCFSVSQAVAYLPFDRSDDHDKLLRALVTSIMGPREKINKSDFVSWCSKHIPYLFNGTHSFLLIKLSGATFDDTEWHKRMSQEGSLNQNDLSNSAMSMLCSMDSNTSSLTACILWILTTGLPNLYIVEQKRTASKFSIVPNFLISRLQMLIEQRPWCLLYNSDENGLSVNRFEHHVYSYKGPSVMIISFDNNLYILATDCEWRESSAYWGGENTVLIQLLPRFAIADRGKIIFLNHHTRGMFKGIQIGSNPKSPILKIADMTTVTHYGVELTLEAIEVWGCASTEIRDIQLRQKTWERKEVEKLHNRKLKLENWEDNPDRMLLNWVGISTNHQEHA